MLWASQYWCAERCLWGGPAEDPVSTAPPPGAGTDTPLSAGAEMLGHHYTLHVHCSRPITRWLAQGEGGPADRILGSELQANLIKALALHQLCSHHGTSQPWSQTLQLGPLVATPTSDTPIWLIWHRNLLFMHGSMFLNIGSTWMTV